MALVLFIDSVHPCLQEFLEQKGYTCALDESSNWDELERNYGYAEGLVLRSRLVVDDDVLARFPSLRFIARSGSGMENIDVTAARERGIAVFSSPEGNADAVAEHVLGMILTLFNRYPEAHASVKRGEWKREFFRGRELKHTTVGLIGMGHMGTAVVQRLLGFGCTVLGHDLYLLQSPLNEVPLVSLQEIQHRCDIVSIHLPLSLETRGYANSDFFNGFSKPIVFINTARGQHCVTADLLEALKEGKVLQAGLDVLEFESAALQVEKENSPVYTALMADPRVLLTPHVAGWTVESYVKLSSVLAQKIDQWLQQESVTGSGPSA